MFNNYNLCHIRTINWDEIITGHNAKYTYVYNFTSPERECPACHANCTAGCWGEVSTPDLDVCSETVAARLLLPTEMPSRRRTWLPTRAPELATCG